MKHRQYYVYIMMNANDTVPYIGVTNDLERRVYEHAHHVVEGFTSRYKLHKLVYFDVCYTIEQAIVREKQLKNWHRGWKMSLIRASNPNFNDLAQKLFQIPNHAPSQDGAVRNDEVEGLFYGKSFSI